MKWSKRILKLVIAILLTGVTQIGGILYLLVELTVPSSTSRYRLKKGVLYIGSYLVLTFFIVPLLAPLGGRVKLKDTHNLEAVTFTTKLFNRDYVTTDFQNVLYTIANDFELKHPGIKVQYLDANFPFINGFQLPPHLSHNDGKKIDLSFIYKNKQGKIINDKPSISGYGVFEAPKPHEYDQITKCKNNGNWQYSIASVLTYGYIDKSITFSEAATKNLFIAIIRQKKVKKIFLEPHLKNRLGLIHEKIRYHGCHAVRHDDHIHIQL